MSEIQIDMNRVREAAGGNSRLAKAVGLHRASVWGWTRIPAERVAAVEAATGIPRHELRPDLYQAPEAA